MAFISAYEDLRNGHTGIRRLLRRYVRDRRGNIAAITALLIIPLVGVLGVATETSGWFLIQRAMQNAADSAAIAAATNNNTTANGGVPSYQIEANAVTKKFGFTNGANSTTVTVVNNDNSAPVCASKCYKVTITRNVPIYLTKIVGYMGTGGAGTQAVSASASAIPQNVPTSYCLVSLGSGDGFHVNGGKNVDLHGCNVLSNGDVTCNGSNSNGGANSITYLSNNKKCSPAVHASSAFVDPYAWLAASVPPNSCSAYPNNPISGSLTWGSVQHYCGNVTLAANTTLTTPGNGTVLVIENGDLVVPGGMTLSTAAGSGLTVLFTGTNAGSHILSGGGTLDFSAPRAGSGTWSGVAVYQNPALTSGVDMSAAGNSPTWNISGLIYVPKSDLSFSGAVNKASNGLNCFVLVDQTFQTNGTGDILENQSQCAQQGVNLPSASNFVRTSLVY